MAKIGFNGQWIDICRVGKATDSKGTARSLDRAFLEAVIANYAASGHDAALVVGHPEGDTAPAFGWVKDLRLNGDILEAQFAETDDEFKQLVAGVRTRDARRLPEETPELLIHSGVCAFDLRASEN